MTLIYKSNEGKNKRNTQEYSAAVSPLLVSVLLLKGAPWNYAFHYHIFSFLGCHEAVSKTILSSKRQYNIILYIWKNFKIKIFQKPVTNSWTIQYHLVCMENFQNKNTSKTSNKFMGNKQARVQQNIKLYMRASFSHRMVLFIIMLSQPDSHTWYFIL